LICSETEAFAEVVVSNGIEGVVISDVVVEAVVEICDEVRVKVPGTVCDLLGVTGLRVDTGEMEVEYDVECKTWDEGVLR